MIEEIILKVAGSLILAVYVSLAIWTIFGIRADPHSRMQARLSWLLLLPIAMFVTYWFVGRVVWSLLIGVVTMTNPNNLDGLFKGISVFFALLISSTAFLRIATGAVSVPFLRILAAGTVVLASLYCVATVGLIVAPIEGGTDVEAAEEVLANSYGKDDSTTHLRLVPEIPTATESPYYVGFPIPSEFSSFVVYDGDRAISHTVVKPYRKYWWTPHFNGPIRAHNQEERKAAMKNMGTDK